MNIALLNNTKLFRRLVLLVCTIIIVSYISCRTSENKNSMPGENLKEEALNTLRNILNEQQEWVKVHAAEFLIWTGNARGVKQAYLKESELFSGKPQYRVGIWRVLAQVSDSAEAEQYKKQITQAFLDTAGKDRIHAIETMAKLKMSPLPHDAFEVQAALKSDIKNFVAYTRWAIAYTSTDSMKSAKKYFLGRMVDNYEDMLMRRIAAYVLRNSGSLEKQDWVLLKNMVLSLQEDAEGKISFLNAALLTVPDELMGGEDHQKILDQLLAFGSEKIKITRMDIAAGLAVMGTEEHLPLLAGWLRNADPTGKPADDADVQASAAYAILQISKRLGTP